MCYRLMLCVRVAARTRARARARARARTRTCTHVDRWLQSDANMLGPHLQARAHAYLAGKPFVVLSNKADTDGTAGTTDDDVVAALGLEPNGQEGRVRR